MCIPLARVLHVCHHSCGVQCEIMSRVGEEHLYPPRCKCRAYLAVAHQVQPSLALSCLVTFLLAKVAVKQEVLQSTCSCF